MPVYEYVCKGCKNKFELMRPFSQATASADCPRCRKKAQRVLSACYSKSANEYGGTEPISGTSGGGCSSCSSGNCSSCGAS